MKFNILKEPDGWRWYLQKGDGEVIGKSIRAYDSHVQVIGVVCNMKTQVSTAYIKMLSGSLADDKQAV